MTANPVAKKGPKVDLDATREKLGRLGLLHASDHMGETLAEAAKNDWPPHRFLDRLLEDELRVREERRLRTATWFRSGPWIRAAHSKPSSYTRPSRKRSRTGTTT